MQFDGHSIIGIVTIVLGAAFIICGLVHEITWLRRRGWALSKGVVIDHKGDGKDGSVKYPVIEYHTGEGGKSFVSKYGGAKPPEVGSEVNVAHHPSMEAEEHFTISNRILFSVLAISIGLIITIVGTVILMNPGDTEDESNPSPESSEIESP
jgi:hypothetical protein